MDDWFSTLAAKHILSPAAVEELRDVGFIVVPGPIISEGLGRMAEEYDASVATALASDETGDAKIAKATTRVSDLANRSWAFDGLYVFPPLLDACCRVIGRPFKFSSMLARTLRPQMPAQELHADFKSNGSGWPMVGFIFMIDDFRPDNGATRFVPGSHSLPASPEEVMEDTTADYEGQVLACGPAGSMIIYNGSTWHGHTANQTAEPRRSVQGGLIRRDAQAAHDQRTRIRPETFARIGDLAKYLLDVEPDDGSRA